MAETPTPEALAQARKAVRECSHVEVIRFPHKVIQAFPYKVIQAFPYKAACCQCIALVLTEQARQIEPLRELWKAVNDTPEFGLPTE